MTRSPASFFSLLALAFFAVALAPPPISQDIVALGGVHTMNGWSYTDCGSPNDIVTINSLELSPDPPRRGQNLTITLSAYTSERIKEGAYANVDVRLGLIKLLSKNFDLCEEAMKANASVQCPIEKGSYVIEQTVTLPKEIPAAIFTINTVGYNFDDENLFCLKLTVDFMRLV